MSYNILLIINSCLLIHHLVATPLVRHRRTLLLHIAPVHKKYYWLGCTLLLHLVPVHKKYYWLGRTLLLHLAPVHQKYYWLGHTILLPLAPVHKKYYWLGCSLLNPLAFVHQYYWVGCILLFPLAIVHKKYCNAPKQSTDFTSTILLALNLTCQVSKGITGYLNRFTSNNE